MAKSRKLQQTKEGTCTIVDLKNPQPPPPAPGQKSANVCGWRPPMRKAERTRTLDGVGISMADLPGVPFQSFTGQLSLILGRTVIDKTGLTGIFDVHLEWTPDEVTAGAPGPWGPGDSGRPAPSADLSGPSIFSAVQEQLGLKLESAKGPVEILVIDHVERPTEN